MGAPLLLQHTKTGTIYPWTQQLAARSDMVEYLGEPDRTTDITYLSQFPKLSGTIRFHLEAKGIGDAICALYASCGLANQGHQVEFHTRHAAWIKVKHPNLTILQSDAQPFDCSANYRDQLYASYEGRLESRVHWYLQNICIAYGLEPCKPARPAEVFTSSRRKYVLLAPFSSGESRDWHWAHFRRLAKALLESGIQVAITASEAQRQRAYEAFYGLEIERFIGENPETAIRRVAQASVLVANDSGMAHIGGLYETPTLCLLAQFQPSYLFKCADSVKGIVAKTSCSGCHTIVAAGWDQVCNQQCSALQTISPDTVIQTVRKLYETS